LCILFFLLASFPGGATALEDLDEDELPPDDFTYWEIVPQEPRLRWRTDKGLSTLTDWQVGYSLSQDRLIVGGVDFGPK